KASDRSVLEKIFMILLLWDQSDLVATKKNRSYAPKFYHEKFNNIRRLRRINRFVKTILNPLKIKKARNLGSAPHRGHIEGASAFAPPPTMMAIRGGDRFAASRTADVQFASSTAEERLGSPYCHPIAPSCRAMSAAPAAP